MEQASVTISEMTKVSRGSEEKLIRRVSTSVCSYIQQTGECLHQKRSSECKRWGMRAPCLCFGVTWIWHLLFISAAWRDVVVSDVNITLLLHVQLYVLFPVMNTPTHCTVQSSISAASFIPEARLEFALGAVQINKILVRKMQTVVFPHRAFLENVRITVKGSRDHVKQTIKCRSCGGNGL